MKIRVQARLLSHLSAINQFQQENRNNPLLQELEPELSALGRSLSSTFAGLSTATVAPQAAVQFPNPSLEFQNLQSRLTGLSEAGADQPFDIASRLEIGLIDRGLERLVSTLNESLAWQARRCATVPEEFSIALAPAG